MYTPDVLFPSNNEYGIPLLDLNGQARFLETPVVKWGTIKRASIMQGTYHFYTDDYKFSKLWTNPSSLFESSCRVIVEPNVSTTDHMPLVVGLYKIYQKRWITRYCQSLGIDIFVDLCVERQFVEHNLLGVPKGWRAYANRAYSDDRLEWLEEDYQLACKHAGTESIIYVVYGGGKKARELSIDRGWIWIPEQADAIRGRFRDDTEKLNTITSIKHDLRLNEKTQQEIAAEHGVTQATVSDINVGKTWGHVTLDEFTDEN